MAVLTSGFETGVDTNTIATSDSGNNDAWDVVNIGTGATCAYSSTYAANGSLSSKYETGVTSAGCSTRWTTKFGTLTDHYGRLYLYMTANPAAELGIVTWAITGGAGGFSRFGPKATGVLNLRSANSPQTQTSGAVAIGLNKWIRIEWHIVHSTTVGQMEVKLFNTFDSLTPDETITSAASLNMGTGATAQWHGHTIAGSNLAALWIDNVVAGADSYPGPAAIIPSLVQARRI